MADQPITTQPEDETNPYAPPSDLDDRLEPGDLEAPACRAHLKEESYAKGLIITNLFYVFVFGAFLTSRGRILISHWNGTERAPWILQPASVALQLITVALWICALSAAYGFFRRKRWALRFEWVLAFCLISGTALDPLLRTEPPPLSAGLGQAAMLLMFAAPLLDFWHLRSSVIFDPAYTHAIAATSQMSVWPKLSRTVTLLELGLLVVLVVSVVLSRAS